VTLREDSLRDSPARDQRAPACWLVVPSLCLGLATPGPAAAQSAVGALPIVAAPPPPAAAASAAQLLDEGRPLLLEAHRLFRAGQPAASIPLLERAYQLGKWPGCLLNLAMAHHALSDCAVALGYYQRYLSADPYTDRHAEVTAAVQELTAICGASVSGRLGAQALAAEQATSGQQASAEQATSGQQASAGQASAGQAMAVLSGAALPGAVLPGAAVSVHARPPALSQPRPEQHAPALPAPVPSVDPPPSRALEWSLLGTGLASGVAALGFALASQRKDQEAARFESFAANDPRARDVHDAGVRYNHLSLAFGLGALALLGGGAALWLWSEGPGTPAAPDLAGLQYRGRF
jgi:hypothetical protein